VTREAVIEVLLEHPELMQRPIIIRGQTAVLARPSEKVLEILD
jgi:arsenate reductase